MREIIETIKKYLPESSIKISNILGELLEEIELVVENFIAMGYLPEELDEIYEELQDIEEEMKLGYGQLDMVGGSNSPDELDIRPNYEDYKVDNTVEHTLIENFTHIKPYGFQFLDYNIEAKNWKELYIKACEMFLKIDEEIFFSFINKTSMNGKKKDYFSKNKYNIVGPVRISNKIYVSTDFSANDFRDLLIKIIREYSYDIKDFKVYFRADYNPLHKNTIS